MNLLSRVLLGSATAATLIVATATPATARPWGGRGYYGHGWGGPRYYRGYNSGFGDFLAGALVVGGIAAIASSASRRDNTDDAYAQGYYDGRSTWGARYQGEQAAAVDRCAYAAGREGQRYAADAMVTDINGIEPTQDGYIVRGIIDVRRASYGGDMRTDRDRFSCKVMFGQVDRVWIDDANAQR